MTRVAGTGLSLLLNKSFFTRIGNTRRALRELDFEVEGVFAWFLGRHLDVQTSLILAPFQPSST
jgi:hypothetical protein